MSTATYILHFIYFLKSFTLYYLQNIFCNKGEIIFCALNYFKKGLLNYQKYLLYYAYATVIFKVFPASSLQYPLVSLAQLKEFLT